MTEAVETRRSALEHLRIARVLEAHGDVIGAICAYREAAREGSEPSVTEALVRIAALAGRQ